MGGCGGSAKKSAPPKKTSGVTKTKAKTVRTNWSTGFGTPKVKFSFGKR